MKIPLWMVAVVLLVSCQSYDNQSFYEVSIGETVSIYIHTNSCCYYCWPNRADARHIQVVDTVVVKPAPERCEGCSTTRALIFKAISPGIDTIQLVNPTATAPCNAKQFKPEMYVIHVQL